MILFKLNFCATMSEFLNLKKDRCMTTKVCILFFLLITILCRVQVNCSPPADPTHCIGLVENSNCTITNSLGAFPDLTICRAAKAVYPTTEAELISAIGSATKARMKMKVATRYSHSIPKLVCPGGDDGVLISTKYLNRVLEIDVISMTMKVESGVMLKQVIDEAAKVNLALPHSPYWLGVSVGGMLGTGAHGSSLWGLGSQVHDYVTQIRIVSPGGVEDGYAKVRTLESGNPEMDATRVSLGVLGVISQVTLQLQPLFKRSVRFVTKSDYSLGDEAAGFGRLHEFADFVWYPSQKQVVYRVDDRVSTNATGNGLNDFIAFRSTPSPALAIVRTTEEALEIIGNVEGKCLYGRATVEALKIAAYGFTNDGNLFTGYPIIGYQNRIQSAGSCLESVEFSTLTTCPWDSRIKGIYYHLTTFSIALSQVKNFIEDIQKLVALEPKSMCVVDLYNGILVRYVTASSAYLGKQEDALDFDITYYRSKNPLTPRLFEDVLEEIEQIAVFKYNALPHWGKNRNIAFEGAINKYKNAGKFLKIKKMYDSLGLFSSDWTDQVLGLRDGLSVVKEGCALEGLCVCSEDVHCAPMQGYYCRQGKVYKEARVCTKDTFLRRNHA